jgi:hypothetical protein
MLVFWHRSLGSRRERSWNISHLGVWHPKLLKAHVGLSKECRLRSGKALLGISSSRRQCLKSTAGKLRAISGRDHQELFRFQCFAEQTKAATPRIAQYEVPRRGFESKAGCNRVGWRRARISIGTTVESHRRRRSSPPRKKPSQWINREWRTLGRGWRGFYNWIYQWLCQHPCWRILGWKRWLVAEWWGLHCRWNLWNISWKATWLLFIISFPNNQLEDSTDREFIYLRWWSYFGPLSCFHWLLAAVCQMISQQIKRQYQY